MYTYMGVYVWTYILLLFLDNYEKYFFRGNCVALKRAVFVVKHELVFNRRIRRGFCLVS